MRMTQPLCGARPHPTRKELETKVAKDYAKFYNHGEGPYYLGAFSVT